MDTKSKKFKAIRIVSFLLCLIFVGGSGFAAARAIRFYNTSGYIYSTQNLQETVEEPLLSKAVLDEIGFAYYAMRRVHITYEDGKIFENSKLEQILGQEAELFVDQQAKNAIKEQENILDAYNELVEYIESGRCDEGEIDEYVNWDRAYYSEKYNLYVSLSAVRDSANFTMLEDGSYEVDKAEIYEYAGLRKPNYSLSVEDYRNEYDYLKDYLSLYSSINYLIVNDVTGELYTNSPYRTAAEFSNAYDNSTWMVSSDNNFETVTVNSVFRSLSDLTREYTNVSGDMAKDFDGRFIKNTTYLSQFFNSIRYGWQGVRTNSGYILGTLEFLEPADATVYISFDSTMFSDADPLRLIYEKYSDTANSIYTVVVLGLIALVLALATTVLLIVLAAKGNNKLGWQNKIPGEIHAILFLGGAVLAGIGASFLIFFLTNRYWIGESYNFELSLIELGFAACAVACYALFMNWLTTLIRSIRGKVYFKRLVVAQPFRFTQRLVDKAAAKLKANSSDKKNGVRRQLVIVISVYLGISFLLWILMCWSAGGLGALFALILLIGLNVAFVLVLYFYAKALDKISDTVKKTQQGDFDVEFIVENMPKPMVELANDIARMRSGMQVAVDSAVREQKAKMDLITNVSHDLKTPLTSIITYSDLIKRSGIADETVDGYANILVEKSFRLKQLIEDLTEATRVSTGAVDLQRTQVSLYELVAQALGENATSLEEKQIDVRMNEPETKPTVFVDGQKTYRVLENIISNIAKYAMPNTRAYVAVGEKEGMGFVSFKNISNEPLNIPAEELMERFVRGDAARGGEGSGLGLSIARDLCQLQGGKFDIQIDGDMFTSTVSLPIC